MFRNLGTALSAWGTSSKRSDAPKPSQSAVVPEFQGVPTELHRRIASYLEPLDVLRYGATCNIARQIARENHVWLTLIQQASMRAASAYAYPKDLPSLHRRVGLIGVNQLALKDGALHDVGLRSTRVERLSATFATSDDAKLARISAHVYVAGVGGQKSPQLWDLAKHPHVEIRLIIASTIGNLSGPKALATLLRLAQDPDHRVREAAATSLGRRKESAALNALLELATDNSALVRLSAVRGLLVHDDAPILNELIRFSYDEEENVRVLALQCLSTRPEPIAADRVLMAARTDDLDVRACAMSAFAVHHDALELLISTASNVGAGTLRPLAISILARNPSPHALAALLRHTDDDDIGVVLAATEALALRSEPEALRKLLVLSNYVHRDAEGGSEVRAIVVRALSGRPDFDRILLRLAEDPELNVRVEVANAFALRRDRESLHSLFKLAKDPESIVVLAASVALAQRGDPEAFGALLALEHEAKERALATLESHNSELIEPAQALRDALISGISKRRGPDGTAALIRLSHDEDATVRRTVAKDLKDRGEPEACEALIRLVNDPDPKVRWHAASSLGHRLKHFPEQKIVSSQWSFDALAQRARSSAAEKVDVVRETRLRALRSLETVNEPDIRKDVAAQLVDHNCLNSLVSLLRLAKNPHPDVRAATARILAARKERSALDALLVLATDAEFIVRWRAARALGKRSEPEAFAALVQLAQDDEVVVRDAVAKSLIEWATIIPESAHRRPTA